LLLEGKEKSFILPVWLCILFSLTSIPSFYTEKAARRGPLHIVGESEKAYGSKEKSNFDLINIDFTRMGIKWGKLLCYAIALAKASRKIKAFF